MANFTLKELPSIECQQLTSCYCIEIIHFAQLAHSHINKIVRQGKVNGKYIIPDELNFLREILPIQCEIVDKLFHGFFQSQLESNETQLSKLKISQNDSEALSSKMSDKKNTKEIVAPKGKMAQKLADAAPYNFFLTRVTASEATHSEPLSITFEELLDDSLGDLESSVQFNFGVDFSWMMEKYCISGHDQKPLLVLYGNTLDEEETDELDKLLRNKPNLTAIKVDTSKTMMSKHHSKISIFCYKDGSSRIVVSTANLIEPDWHNRTQGLWISNQLPAMPQHFPKTYGESLTGFRDDFIRYLKFYNIPNLNPYISRLKRTDFSSVNVFFIASVHGTNFRNNHNGVPLWGHPRVGYLLEKHVAPIIDESADIVAQSSAIGSFGTTARAYLTSEWLKSFRKDMLLMSDRLDPQFKMIYPSYDSVLGSHDGISGAGCLPYMRNTHKKQRWLKRYLCHWQSNERHRTQAIPDIKTYARWSDKGLHWFILTSGNMSRSAWGYYNRCVKRNPPLIINNYEAGVLFIPKFVLKPDVEVFPLVQVKNGYRKFPMPYDIPLVPYTTDDMPFFYDYFENWLDNQEEVEQ